MWLIARVNEDKIKQDDEIIEQFGDYNYGWHAYGLRRRGAKKGIDENASRAGSADKHEPEWMLDKRRIEGSKPIPIGHQSDQCRSVSPDSSTTSSQSTSRRKAGTNCLTTSATPTIVSASRRRREPPRLRRGRPVRVGGVIYNSIQEDLKKQGVIFVDTDTAVRSTLNSSRSTSAPSCLPEDNKFSAFNTAAWSGGSFVYVPKGVHVDIPLQAYFRINTPAMGQFERTLIIADEGSYVHYVEGCTAPIWSTDSLHSGMVEIIVETHARVRYTTVQNWSNNVYNLVTQRAYVREGGTMEWVGRQHIGSKATMKYPACILAEPYAKAIHHVLGLRR